MRPGGWLVSSSRGDEVGVLKAPLSAAFAQVSPAWRNLCETFLASPEGLLLCRRIDDRLQAGALIHPQRPLRALEGLDPQDVRVVILGQDPYHGAGEAEGLAFSVPEGVRIPPSLRNIRQELVSDVGGACPASGSLVPWVAQGVLLLNTCLTVERDRPASHAGWGWEVLTDRIIELVARDTSPKVFMLWGGHAQKKRGLIESVPGHHLVLCSNHPSPLSARRPPVPFLGSRPFSAANNHLLRQGRGVISWVDTR